MALRLLPCRGEGCCPLWWWRLLVAMVMRDLPGQAPLHGCAFPGNRLSLLGSWAAFAFLSRVIGMHWPYLMWLGIIGWGWFFLAWKGIMAYWNTSLLSCGKTYIPGVVCFFCLSGLLSPRLFPCQSTSTTLDFLSWIDQILYLSFSCFLSYISVLHEQV